MSTELEIQGITKRYGNLVAVSNSVLRVGTRVNLIEAWRGRA